MHKMTWETPRIAPVELQSLNSFGRRRSRADSQSEIDGVPLATLVERYGSPLYVTSEQRLRANIRRIRQAFTTHYAKVIHGWSYKTNYNGAVCSILHQEGSWAEVVSRFEYEKARALGVPGEHIVFNGPNKQRPILERAIAEGALIHVDHADELELIESDWRRTPRVRAGHAAPQFRRPVTASPGVASASTSNPAPPAPRSSKVKTSRTICASTACIATSAPSFSTRAPMPRR
jgi:hypothetical protein